MNLRAFRKWLLLYALFDLLVGGYNGGFLPLSRMEAAAQAIPLQQTIIVSGVQGASLPNFTVAPPPQPVVAASTASGTLGAGQWSTRTAFVVTAGGLPTLPSVSTLTTLTAAGTLTVTSPTCPAGVSTYNVYMGAAVGSETQQGSATSCGTAFVQSAALSVGAALPSFNVVPEQVNTLGQQISVGPGAGAADPCASNGVVKTSTFQNISTATTTALVAVSGTTTVYVCQIIFEISGTATPGTVLFEQGTGAACAGAPTALTATYTNGSGTTVVTSVPIVIGGGSSTVLKTASANGLCVVSTVGTGPAIAVTVVFVQQ